MNNRTTCFVISVLMIFRIFGLLPLSLLTRKQSKIVIIISRSEIWLLYNFILIIITLYISCYNGLPMLMQDNDDDFLYNITSVMDLVSVTANILICLILWTLCFVNDKKMEQAADKFLEIDSFMQSICHVEQSEYPVWGCVFIGVIHMVIWSILIWYESLNWNSTDLVIWIFTSIIPSGTVSVCVLQYAFTMQLLTFQFESLNNAFGKFGTAITSSEDQTFVTRRIFEDDNIKNLKSIKCAHRMLYKLTVVISNFYSFPTLIIIGISCFTIIYTVFNLIDDLLISSSSGTFSSISECLWLMMAIFPISILIITLERLTKEYKRTSVEILNLVSRFEDCRRLSSEAKWFLRYITHNLMELTAYGFFKLDSTLFQSILSTAITYLIIAIQFDLSQDEESSLELRNTSFVESPSK